MGNWMTEFPVHFVSAAGVVFKEDKVLLIRSDRRGWELIEKENEKLKERDRQRENEMSEIRRKSEEEITAVKEEYEEKIMILLGRRKNINLPKQNLI